MAGAGSGRSWQLCGSHGTGGRMIFQSCFGPSGASKVTLQSSVVAAGTWRTPAASHRCRGHPGARSKDHGREGLPKGSSCWGQGLISVAPCRQQPPRAGAAGTRLGQGHWGAAAAGVAPSSRRDTECGSPASPPGLRAGHPPRYLMAPPAPGCRLFPHPGVPHPARKHPPAVQTRAVCE